MNKKVYIKYFLLCFVTAFLIFVDQFSKHLVKSKLNLEKNYEIIHNVFSFEYLENRGVAFGFMSGKMNLITIIVSIVAILIFCVIFKLQKAIEKNSQIAVKFTLLQMLCVFLIAGAIGNLIDRIRFSYVVDFIKFDFITFPTFNVADCYVTVATVILFIVLMFFIKEDELNLILEKKSKKKYN